MRRTLCTLTACALALLLAAPALTQTPVRLPELDAATTPLGDDDLFLVRQDGQTRDKKVTWSTVRASLQDALVLGPASVCVDNQLARWDGASNTQLQCSALTVADTTGDITAPGALTISTAGSNGDITLDPNGTGSVILGTPTYIGGETYSDGAYWGGFYVDPTGGSSKYGIQVMQGGSSTNTGNLYAKELLVSLSNTGDVRAGLLSTGTYQGLNLASDAHVSWSNSTDIFSGASDLYLHRDAAATLAQRNGTNAQTYRLYGTYTDASNYERVALSCDGSADCTLAAETAGTGADNLSLTLKPAGTEGIYAGANGITSATPVGVVINATGGSGTDIAGASLTLAGGKGTGNAAGGSVVIQTSDPGSTGTKLQTLATRVTVGVARTTIANILSLTGLRLAPGSPAAGDIVYDSVNNLFCGYNGSAWVSFSDSGRCWAE